ncbi:MAG: DUF1905 domain-containing protein [Candidatus Pacebacteria bacterium]|nr:DUF1905 domain-containing protein [Candidatus Paceibacterota bacterium]
MKSKKYTISSKIFLWQGASAWHFVAIPKKESENIKKVFSEKKRGWGSLRVLVVLGKTTWATSIFPDSKSGQYLLPLKQEVRAKEGVANGDIIHFKLEVEG